MSAGENDSRNTYDLALDFFDYTYLDEAVLHPRNNSPEIYLCLWNWPWFSSTYDSQSPLSRPQHLDLTRRLHGLVLCGSFFLSFPFYFHICLFSSFMLFLTVSTSCANEHIPFSRSSSIAATSFISPSNALLPFRLDSIPSCGHIFLAVATCLDFLFRFGLDSQATTCLSDVGCILTVPGPLLDVFIYFSHTRFFRYFRFSIFDVFDVFDVSDFSDFSDFFLFSPNQLTRAYRVYTTVHHLLSPTSLDKLSFSFFSFSFLFFSLSLSLSLSFLFISDLI
ncbi:uncharacterized protein YALI1_D27934g [Yarrowia lipolytica]|uniref:Uncharacterized protein n=1 Tax=Yarrowia lipolytica TaxID=4952 RepID=A0A1D8NFN5_YARLL|nr:hypothetical protein YALI1_D27934g [Yarrowia lipolytica]